MSWKHLKTKSNAERADRNFIRETFLKKNNRVDHSGNTPLNTKKDTYNLSGDMMKRGDRKKHNFKWDIFPLSIAIFTCTK